MRAAPAFELHVAPGRGERSAVAMIAAACAAVLGGWVWSHVDALAGPAGRGGGWWFVVCAGAALCGGWLGWRLGPRRSATVAWRQGQWTLQRAGVQAQQGVLQAKLDLGGWLLLRFRPDGGGAATWLGVGRDAAGPVWHALRATLFVPVAADGVRGRDKGERA